MKKLDRVSIYVATRLEEAAFENKMGLESKKKKSETNALKEVSDCTGTEYTVMEDAFERSKEDKRKKYNKKTEFESVETRLEYAGNGDNTENAQLLKNKTQEMETKQGDKRNRKKFDSVETCPENPNRKVKSKKVRFSGHVEAFPSSDGPSKGKEQNQEEGLVRGKRFTPEEDEKVRESVLNYIKAHNLGEEGLHMILHCKSYPNVRNCWKEIVSALSNRPHQSVYKRAHMMFKRDEKRSWTAEEIELLRRLHAKHGAKWTHLAAVLGKHGWQVRDTWRRIKLPNKKAGNWSQEECQSLFDLVNTDLQLRIFGEKKTKHGMLRDNISWSAVSDRLSTRTDAGCCRKWYAQLTSPLVAEGKWANVDDYRLLYALFSLDACCIEDVDWDNLLDHRSGDVCRKRWNQMVSHIGEHGNKLFSEQVEVLSKRYCPDLVETREAWDSKPFVD